MGKLDGRVALVTGAARGQGRSHAVRLASEGADIIALDVCQQIETVPYPLATDADLKETARLVEALDRRILACRADVRSTAELVGVVENGIAEFGKIDILVANAGIFGFTPLVDLSDLQWTEMIDVNLMGVFKTMRAVLPNMIEHGYGRIVAISSIAGRTGFPNFAHYSATKWGVIGMTKALAREVADKGITVNVVCPTNVGTDMIFNDAAYGLFRPDLDRPTKDDIRAPLTALNVIPVPWVEPVDVSEAVLFFTQEEARFITGDSLHVSAGWSANNSA